MKRTIAILACLMALTAIAEGKTSQKRSLAEINAGWMNKTITVRNVKGTPNVMDLLKAFHAVWPTQAGESLIAEVGDRLYVPNDVTECDDCTGHTFVDCEDLHIAQYDNSPYDSQRLEARAFQRDGGHILFAICLYEGYTTQMPVCCYYDYNPSTRTMTPEQVPYSTIHRKSPDSQIHCHLGWGYDQTVIVQESLPEGGDWYHHYVYDGNTHIYNHSGEDSFDDEEEEMMLELPNESVKKDETDEMELYLSQAYEGSDEISMWLVDKRTGDITHVMRTNNDVEPRWEQMSKGRGVNVPIDEIAIGDCYNCFFIPWNHNYIYIEGCPDGRNIWSYVIDFKDEVCFQFPSNSGLYKIDPENKVLHMSSYEYYPEGGRYTIVRTYTIDEYPSYIGDDYIVEE